MKPILYLLILCASLLPAVAQTTFTINLTATQLVLLTNAVEAANLTAQEVYATRTNEVATLRAAGDRFATNPPPPVVLTPALYIQGFADAALLATQGRVETDLANELKNRIDKLTFDERKDLRKTLPRR